MARWWVRVVEGAQEWLSSWETEGEQRGRSADWGLLAVAPQEGSIPTHHRNKKTEFGEYLRKANELGVDLKSTAH
jgi:hypothetical protein